MLDRIGGNVGLLQSVVAIFEEDHPAQLARIGQAIRDGDPVALTSAAHTLKGSLLALAADRAARIAIELEKMGRESRLEGAAELLTKLESEVLMVSAEFEKILKERATVAVT
jgi:HPt (histidine-containing phosphotransfer) domain-containing protein